jgi:probable phosphoglycerate mutase
VSGAAGTRVRDFVFVRHGETDWNREHRVQGSLGASLNSAGQDQSKALARLLWEVPFQAVYSSARWRPPPTSRARTAWAW